MESLIFDMNLDDKKQYIQESSNWNRMDLLYINQVLIDSAFILKILIHLFFYLK